MEVIVQEDTHDVIPERSGSMVKQILCQGVGTSQAIVGCEVTTQMVVHDDLSGCMVRTLEKKWTLGDDEYCEAIQLAVMSMCAKEHAVFHVDPQVWPDVLNGELVFRKKSEPLRINLLKCSVPLRVEDMSSDDFQDHIVLLKKSGDMLYQRGAHWLAAAAYNVVLNGMAKRKAFKLVTSEEAASTKIRVQLNYGAVNVKLGRWQDAISICSEVLEVEPDNVKALYRRAVAHSEQRNLQSSLHDLRTAHSIKPGDAEVHALMKKVWTQKKSQSAVAKRMMCPVPATTPCSVGSLSFKQQREMAVQAIVILFRGYPEVPDTVKQLVLKFLSLKPKVLMIDKGELPEYPNNDLKCLDWWESDYGSTLRIREICLQAEQVSGCSSAKSMQPECCEDFLHDAIIIASGPFKIVPKGHECMSVQSARGKELHSFDVEHFLGGFRVTCERNVSLELVDGQPLRLSRGSSDLSWTFELDDVPVTMTAINMPRTGAVTTVVERSGRTLKCLAGFCVVCMQHKWIAVAGAYDVKVFSLDSGQELFCVPLPNHEVSAMGVLGSLLVVVATPTSFPMSELHAPLSSSTGYVVSVRVLEVPSQPHYDSITELASTQIRDFDDIDMQNDTLAVAGSKTSCHGHITGNVSFYNISPGGISSIPVDMLKGEFQQVALCADDDLVITAGCFYAEPSPLMEVRVWHRRSKDCLLRMEANYDVTIHSCLQAGHSIHHFKKWIQQAPYFRDEGIAYGGSQECRSSTNDECRDSPLTEIPDPQDVLPEDPLMPDDVRTHPNPDACGEPLHGARPFEFPAVVPPTEAERIANEMWATTIEQQIQQSKIGAARMSLPKVALENRRLMVLCFSRHPSEFEEVLISCSLAQKMSKLGYDVRPAWANGAKIFADGVTAADLEETRVELCPRHVAVYENDEHQVFEALQALPYKIRPRLKPSFPRASAPLADELSMFNGSVSTGSSGVSMRDPYVDTSSEIVTASLKTDSTIEPPLVQPPYEVFVSRTFINVREPHSSSPRTVHTV